VIRAVLDANVLVSAAAGAAQPDSVPGEILRRWRGRAFALVVSEPILVEVERTLAKPYVRERLTPLQTAAILRLLRRRAELTAMTARVTGVASHAEDDLVLATARSAAVDWLVSGDRQLQQLRRYQGTTILSPPAFLALLNREGSTSR
jgi:putative PIN family toxin of toxin-antitoxin system